MNLESLKYSKFEAFKENRISRTFAIFGGEKQRTNNPDKKPNCPDWYEAGTKLTGHYEQDNKTPCDYWPCENIIPHG